MTKNDATILLTMLEELLERYGNDGCNDLELRDTPENRELCIAAGETGDNGEPHKFKGILACSNHVILDELIDRFKRHFGV